MVATYTTTLLGELTRNRELQRPHQDLSPTKAPFSYRLLAPAAYFMQSVEVTNLLRRGLLFKTTHWSRFKAISPFWI